MNADIKKETSTDKHIITQDFNFWYGSFHALMDVNFYVREKRITAIIGPSGCGKSTLLRCFNRMNDLIEETSVKGQVFINGINIYDPQTDLVSLRKKVGMVFQRPNPFPLSIFDNVIFSTKIHKNLNKSELQGVVEESLKSVQLWDILKDKLRESALSLSLEQQQRLCIARLMPVKPDILLMDEPCSALDPVATQRIEELMQALKVKYSVVIVTHNMQQAARVSDDTGFMLLGKLIEFGKTSDVFTNPKDKRTEDYITGRYG
ncbi:MAG: phosphate ABC transporter ATP-binding protein PstB [Chlamydiota bacterium]|nr:phosphate ABC transporter ATP-binding protein PstB [Chlamydiota bacterium]